VTKFIIIICLMVAGGLVLLFGGTILSVEGPSGIVSFWRALILPSTLRVLNLALSFAFPVTVVTLLWMIYKKRGINE
jgi:hypothetical protein